MHSYNHLKEKKKLLLTSIHHKKKKIDSELPSIVVTTFSKWTGEEISLFPPEIKNERVWEVLSAVSVHF